MGSIDDSLRPGTRRWIAWKLVQLAHRIYNATFYERIAITETATGREVTYFEIESDMYGGGVSSAFGVGGLAGYSVTWDEFEPDWLHEDEAGHW